MLVKMWFVITCATLILVAIVGALSIVRHGCHLYERFAVRKTQLSCDAAVAVGEMTFIFLFIAQVLAQTCGEFARQHGWSDSTGLLLAIGVTAIIMGAAALLAHFSFWLGKTATFVILQHQQRAQRAECRKLQEQVAATDFSGTACEDVLEQLANCRGMIIEQCAQACSKRCPVGLKQAKLGYLDEHVLHELMEAHAPELTKMAKERVVELGDAPASVVVTVPFTPYYRGEKAVVLHADEARDLERFMANFVADDEAQSA